MKPRLKKIFKSLLSVGLVLLFIAESYCVKEISLEGKAYAELRDKLRIWDIDRSRRRAQNKATSYPRNISDHFIVDTITIPNPVIFKLGDYDYVVSDSIFRACYNPADSSFSREEYLLRYLQYHLDGYNYPPHSFLSTSDYFLQAEISVLANGYYNPFRDDFVFEPIPDSTHENKIPVDSIYFTIKPEAQIIDVFCYDPVIWRFRYENGKWIFVSHR